MDRGPLEREKAESIKLEILRSGTRRKRHRALSTTSHKRPSTSSEVLIDGETLAASRSEPITETPQQSDQTPAIILDCHFIPDDNLLSGLLTGSNNLGNDLDDISFDHNAIDEASVASSIAFSGNGSDSEKGLMFSVFPHWNTGCNNSVRSLTGAHAVDACDQESHIGFSMEASRQFFSNNSVARAATPTSRELDKPDLMDKSTSFEDAVLLSRYLRRTIRTQFPFSSEGEPDFRRWIGCLLHVSEHVAQITLILSRTLSSGIPDQELNHGSTRHLSQAMSVAKTLPSPTSTLSLLDIEVKRTNVLIASSSYSDELGACQDIASQVLQVQATSARQCLSQLLWFDIIGMISAGSETNLGIDHKSLLESEAVDMAQISGCPNLVGKCLLEIFALNHWKRREEEHRRLSIIEMAQRGNRILESLTDCLDELSACQISTTTASLLDTREFERLELGNMMNIVGLVFVRAASIYLYAVLSGPNRSLAEIQRELKAMLKELEDIAGKGLLGHVSWPICVAGCLAGDQDWNDLRCMVLAMPRSVRKAFETCERALQLAEVFRTVGEFDQSHLWTDVALSRDMMFLLL
ncbi:hypothetical protein CNYM01_08480 [Colletotrichum nymphaeae SA-01]|uniref:C6 transcription factor n=1 Tax=Colletotrichum nymphaeae SA-01 TaxID=1460502 RepID=A0A135TE94_9PEZI|nr:hypothetical protein CNYM01_08480 [Colletotrichum nymphaeae SA-01]